MPDTINLEARLDAVAAQMPRFRQDLARVFADIGERAGPPHPLQAPATDPPQRRDRSDTGGERARRH